MKAWAHAPASLGIFTAEGGQFTGGHGMSQDNRLRTAASLSMMWDGRIDPRVRALDGVAILNGRRLSAHLMVQPEAAAGFLSDATLRDQGLLSRVLVAAPDSLAGTRAYREADERDDAIIQAYGARILEILETPWPLAGSDGLTPRVLDISEDATARWRVFYNDIERRTAPGGDLHSIRDFAAKAAEHAARIAGVLTIVQNVYAAEIGERIMADALTLASWYVGEAVRLHQAARTDPTLLRAKNLLDWLQARGGEIRFAEVLQYGPAATRTKKEADASLAILEAHGWVKEVRERPRTLVAERETRQ